MSQRLLLVLGMFLATAAATLAAPAPAETDEVVKDRAAFLPYRKYHALPGKTVGVLVSDVAKVMGLDGRSGPADAMAFSSNGGSYRWIYVPAQGNPLIRDLRVHVGEKGEQTVVYPRLNMANAQTVKQWGVNAAYALVEVEVNDGQGAPADEGFVATKMTVLDGSKEFPLHVAGVVGEMKKKYRTYLDGRQQEIDAAMSAAQKKALKDRKPTGPRETEEVFYITWLPQAQRLRVAFRTTITDGAYQYGGGTAIDGGPARRPPRVAGARFGTSFGVELGRAYEVSKNGDVVKALTLPVQAFQKELPPPPAPLIGRDPPPLPPAKP